MCEPYPGPRCSYDAGKKVVARRSKLAETQKRYGTEDSRTRLAQARLEQAITEYHATPDGITTLENQETDPENKQLLTTAKLTRRLQQQALQETRNGRPEAYATLLQQLHPYHTREEILSILETAREQSIRNAINNSNEQATEKANQPSPTELLIHKAAPNLEDAPKHLKEAAIKLQQLETEQPLNRAFHLAYQNAITNGPTLMKKAMRRELTTLSRIHGVPEQRLASYYEAYKHQYTSQYANLPARHRPDPPAHWLAGEFNQSGQTRHPLTTWLPRDPAAVYALARLRYDPQAIPDHERTTTAYVACTLTQDPNQADTTIINLQPYTPAGKPAGAPTNLTAHNGRLLAPEASQVDHLVTGRTLLTSNTRAQITLLRNQKHLPLNNTLQPADLVALNDEYPDYQTDRLLNLKQLPHTPAGIATLFFQNRKNGTTQWSQKPARKHAAPLTEEELPTSTRWDKLWAR